MLSQLRINQQSGTPAVRDIPARPVERRRSNAERTMMSTCSERRRNYRLRLRSDRSRPHRQTLERQTPRQSVTKYFAARVPQRFVADKAIKYVFFFLSSSPSRSPAFIRAQQRYRRRLVERRGSAHRTHVALFPDSSNKIKFLPQYSREERRRIKGESRTKDEYSP